MNVTEKYLVDALSFTEAEARITEEMKPFISGEFTISNIKRARISELFPNDAGDKWYRCKVFFISFDEVSGNEKRASVNMMVQASSVEEASEVLNDGMKGTLADYEIGSITETKILGVYYYEQPC